MSEDDLCADCDWPAAPLGATRLTTQADAVPATVARLEDAFSHAVELGMQAFEKTGDVREAIIEALALASHRGRLEGQAATATG